MQSEYETAPKPQMPDNFPSILHDFLSDLINTFPEYIDIFQQLNVKGFEEGIYSYCLGIFPERFFDILYQNEDIFDSESLVNTEFFPNLDFKLLFNAVGISENTKQAMWKYLQLILITIMSGIKDKTGFGETMNLFEGIDENELQNKLTETIDNLTDFFKSMETGATGTTSDGDGATSGRDDGATSDANSGDFESFKNSMPEFSFEDMPDAAGLHEHLKGLFDGKIGKLAKELAEEMSGEFMGMFGNDQSDIHSTQDVFKKIMKNPKKIMDLLKTVGSKLESKMKDGEISKEEIMKEASELMGKMKGMGNGKEFQEMMKNLTKNMGNLSAMAGGKGGKFDMNAMQRMSSQYSQKERMRSKLDKKKANEGVVLEKKGENTYTFNLEGEEKQEKSTRPEMRIPELVIPPSKKSLVDKSSVDKSSVDKSSVDKSSVDKSQVDKLQVDKSLDNKSSVDNKSVDDWLEENEPTTTTKSTSSKKKKTKGKK